MTPAERPFDTIESLSQWLKCSRGTVYNLMADGMPYLTLTRGGDRRFDRDAVLRWLEDRKAVAS
jgi:excisionase family DNA binding protein